MENLTRKELELIKLSIKTTIAHDQNILELSSSTLSKSIAKVSIEENTQLLKKIDQEIEKRIDSNLEKVNIKVI